MGVSPPSCTHITRRAHAAPLAESQFLPRKVYYSLPARREANSKELAIPEQKHPAELGNVTEGTASMAMRLALDFTGFGHGVLRLKDLTAALVDHRQLRE